MLQVSSFRPNSSFPQLCDKVTVNWDAKRGRFVEATEDIPVGTVVCVEQGITVNVDTEKCYRCLRNIGHGGMAFRYCDGCEEFYEPDGLACGEFDQFGIFKLAAHLVFSFPFSDIATLVQSDDPKIPCSAPSALSTSDILATLQLTPFREIGETFKHVRIQEAIAKIVKSLDDDANWGRLEYRNRVVTFTKALRIMAERCAKNAHTIYSIEQKESQEDEVPIGTGLFPIASIFNHSCTPNVSAFFIRNTFVFVSHGVRAGEELVDSYGVTYQQNTFKQRTDFLASVSGFRCHCHSCVEKKSLNEQLGKYFNGVEQCAREASCLLDFSDYSEYMTHGNKEIENLIVAFARRPDAEIYSESMFNLWKTFVDNAKVRGIHYDPYLIRPYVEMTLLVWNDDVVVSEEEKMSILVVAHRLLRNFYADLHPLSDLIRSLVDFAHAKNTDRVRTTVERLKIRMRYIWRTSENSMEF